MLTLLQLKDALPQVEVHEIESGAYYLNLHIVTGRKPQSLRAGDLLPDGSRQEMTEWKYNAMARFADSTSNKWTRHLKK
jgi:hypothetical protein